MMKDSELRAIVLGAFYERRRQEHWEPDSDDFTPPVPMQDLFAICEQLHAHGLIHFVSIRSVRGGGQITANGIDVVENEGRNSPLPLTFPVTQHINFNSPSNVQIGNQNSQAIEQTFHLLVERIEAANAAPEAKAEVKSRLRALLEHPLVVSVLGGVAGSLASGLK